jgi:two-component system, sensor histidine kinase and response regulator
VMVTAHGREMLAQRSAEEQSALDGFLVKPVTASMLVDALANARAESGQPPLSRPAALPGARRLVGLRLLVVEDNANNRQVAEELLGDEGAQLTLAADGFEGKNAALAADPPFDCVLMDLQMPVMDGYTATAEIRQQFAFEQLPIIAMTANAMEVDRTACLAAGMNDHVGKPFDLDHLVATLLRHSRRAPQAQAEAPPERAAAAKLPDELLRTAAEHGIELATAIKRLGGNAAAYLRLLLSFSTDLQTQPARLTALLERGDRVEASRLMHTLKGVAATLGLRALAAVAADAEGRFARADAAPHDGRASAELAAAASTALTSLAALAAGLQAHLPPPEPAAAGPAAAIDTPALRSDLGALAELLGHGDMQALDLHTRLRQAHAAALQQALQPLDAAMTTLDFAQAALHCRELLDSLAA